eukprot:TRINITY_DN12843_c0_g1_i1.p1 TRINITY_DN12843_c0_g1~~TRINITY_DN12843_c0_g1_i1.p1  ORF type:complete len:432 (+),score=174.62 TRINITY_DN12843_c0_g1_i1:55-1296(+)
MAAVPEPPAGGAEPGPPDEGMSPDDQLQEQQSYLRICEAFRHYRVRSSAIMARRRQHFDELHPKYQYMFGEHSGMFATWEKCTAANAQFLETIAECSDRLFECYFPQGKIKELEERPTAMDVDKVFSTLRQFVRDWGEEGQAERQSTYQPFYDELERRFPDRAARKDIRVLVPGSGLSRLAFEISLRGFWTQGNEFSHHMLVSGHFLLNKLQHSKSVQIFPYVDQTVNVFNRNDQFRPVLIPDVAPAESTAALAAQGMSQGPFSMVAGDFLEVYGKPDEAGTWDCVATCFFIDTAHNIFEYVEALHRMLKPGGVWINLGPLLYHFSDDPRQVSVDLSYEELKKVIAKFGFSMKEERRVQTTYTTNLAGMKLVVYNAVYFTAVKEGNPQTPMGMEYAIQNPHGPDPGFSAADGD